MDENYYSTAYAMCMAKIREGLAGKDAIEETVQHLGSLFKDKEKLREHLRFNISISDEELTSAICSKEMRNREWWNKLKQQEGFSPKAWNRYRAYLQNNKKWILKTIETSINEPTDFVMNCIANPNSGKPEKSYGAVFGYVQSGKTANYIGLINKAADAGYRIIIVLAGMHNNLRSQTQMRIDEEVLGFETSLAYLKGKEKSCSIIGVGTLPTTVNNPLEPVTSRDETGDYNTSRANLMLSLDHPKIFVIKKQKTVLENIYNNFINNRDVREDPKSGKKQFPCSHSLLIIDDEADQASVNTKYKTDKMGNLSDESDVSKINELIRKILSLFQCKSYVGYTATPYANIFIPPTIANDELGDDLFPRDFIVSLPKPNGYIGAKEFFGEDENTEIMPLRRTIDTSLENFIDIKSKKIIAPIPEELKAAILSFIIITAARNVRGQTLEPNSMLVHVNRFNDVQSSLKNLVKDYFDEVASYINGGDDEIINEMHQLWMDDFVPTTAKMKADYPNYMEGISEAGWDDVAAEIKRIIGEHQIQVSEINGKSKDSLCYKEYKDAGRQLNVIAIGGDKLSRGLTLEGLTVSFFMRSSMMYDTLMQMGRWFGFRPKYADLCRLYVSDYLFRWFMVVSFATENLREQISYMNDCNKTPSDFGLRIASHPEMLISSANKIKTGLNLEYTFSNTVSQTRSLDVNASIYNINFAAVEQLVVSMGKATDNHWEKLGRTSQTDHYFWDDVDGRKIVSFFEQYRTSSKASKVNSINIAEYIKDQINCGGLTTWTVCLKNSGNNKPIKIGGFEIKSGLKRTDGQCVFDEENNILSIKALKSKDEEYYDFSSEMLEKKERLKDEKKKDDFIRQECRTREKGLLILCPLDTQEIKDLHIEGAEYKTPFGFIVVFPDNCGYGHMKTVRLNPIAAESGDYID